MRRTGPAGVAPVRSTLDICFDSCQWTTASFKMKANTYNPWRVQSKQMLASDVEWMFKKRAVRGLDREGCCRAAEAVAEVQLEHDSHTQDHAKYAGLRADTVHSARKCDRNG